MLIELELMIHRWSRAKVVEQCLSLPEVGRVEALGEPAVDRRQEVISALPLSSFGPQAREARHSAKLKRPRMLLSGDVHRPLEVQPRLVRVHGRLGQQELAPQPQQFWFPEPLRS